MEWTPSKIIKFLGNEINDESSILYWAAKNEIPIFCPAITDGSLGDMLYFHSIKTGGIKIDILADLREINNGAAFAAKTGVIILGGGIVKHHILNANLMRNGADHAVFINTGQEYDGSDAGARPDEAVSWGKLKPESHGIKVTMTSWLPEFGTEVAQIYADATLIFPLLVAQTFAAQHWQASSPAAQLGGDSSPVSQHGQGSSPDAKTQQRKYSTSYMISVSNS